MYQLLFRVLWALQFHNNAFFKVDNYVIKANEITVDILIDL